MVQGWTSYATNTIIEKTSHPLLAHHVLSDKAQSVWIPLVTQKLVIQLSKYSNFCLLRFAHAYQN